jgi:hypothetical protein
MRRPQACFEEVCLRIRGAYFIAPKRLSNEFDETTG